MGRVMLDKCGVLYRRASTRLAGAVREEFWRDLRVDPGDGSSISRSVREPGYSDFFELRRADDPRMPAGARSAAATSRGAPDR